MKTSLLRGRLDNFGDLLGEAGEQKKRVSPLICTPHLAEIYEIALKHGARGGKVTGAGGGGHMLFYCDFAVKHRVAEALIRHGLAVADVALEPAGLTTWRPGRG
jgi:D-glycero-alpha-D-manno-heptose-7-phosphate kinase